METFLVALFRKILLSPVLGYVSTSVGTNSSLSHLDPCLKSSFPGYTSEALYKQSSFTLETTSQASSQGTTQSKQTVGVNGVEKKEHGEHCKPNTSVKTGSCSKARRELKLKSQMQRPKRRRLRPQRPMIVLRRKVASVKLKEGPLFKTVALFNSVSLMRLR